jgi:hypothetical protein
MDFDQTWYILRRIWNPIDFQGQHGKQFDPVTLTFDLENQ